jgi:hypothetical protein
MTTTVRALLAGAGVAAGFVAAAAISAWNGHTVRAAFGLGIAVGILANPPWIAAMITAAIRGRRRR